MSKKGKGADIPDTSDQQELWDHFQHHIQVTGRTDFFGQIKIDRQAGFDELKDMWGKSRYLFGAVSFITLLANIFSIISLNVTLLSDLATEEKQVCLPQISFIVAKQTWAPFVIGGLYPDVPKFAQGLAAIAILELLLLATLNVWAIYHFVTIFTSRTACKKWHSVANFFFNVFPMIATLSLVKILNFVTPAVVVPDLIGAIKATFTTKTGTCNLVWFLATRTACFLFGFDAFLYKFQVIANDWRLIQADELAIIDKCFEPVPYLGWTGQTVVLLNTLLFVNQLLGIVQLGWFTKQRIFIFIFAGEDGAMSQKEYAIKLTFDAYLCYKVQEEHGLFNAIFFWWSYSDSDFQKMVLDNKDDHSGEESRVARASLAADVPDG